MIIMRTTVRIGTACICERQRAGAPRSLGEERSRALEVCRRERDGRLTVISDGYSLAIVSSRSWIAAVEAYTLEFLDLGSGRVVGPCKNMIARLCISQLDIHRETS